MPYVPRSSKRCLLACYSGRVVECGPVAVGSRVEHADLVSLKDFTALSVTHGEGVR